MAISYHATKTQADAQGGETSWGLVKDGKPWRAATGPDVTPVNKNMDKEEVSAYSKLIVLKGMSPTQVATWVDANVTNLAQAQDAIKTLAVGVGYLIRKALS